MKLESDSLWKKAHQLTTEVYGLLPGLSEDVRWTLNSKLRGRGFDLSNDIAEAVGSVDPRDKSYYYALARRDAFGLKNTLIIGSKSGELEFHPETMVLLDEVAASLDAEIAKADKAIPDYMEKFMAKEKDK